MKANYLFVALVMVFFAMSCGNKKVDLIPPTIDVISYTPAPIKDEICGTEDPNVFRLTGGEDLIFDVLFKDNESLAEYKIDIHNNFDCHGHGGGVAPKIVVPNVNNQTNDWTVLDIQKISGLQAPVKRSLTVPENVTAGNYHFHIQVIDESGNDSPFSNYYSLKVKNPLDDVPPVINATQPSMNSFSIKKGESIKFSGQVTDNRSLSDGGNGILYLAYTDLSSGNSFSTDQSFPFDKDVEKMYSFDFDYTVPLTLKSGKYRFSLGTNDGLRNVGNFVFFEVEITN